MKLHEYVIAVNYLNPTFYSFVDYSLHFFKALPTCLSSNISAKHFAKTESNIQLNKWLI
jgi:hypothetical protein